MKKRIIAALVLTAFSMSACGTPTTSGATSSTATPTSSSAESITSTTPAASSAPTYTLMFGHAQTETHPYQASFSEWADAVSAATNGDLVVDLYASNTLGSEEDIINSFKNSDTNWGYNTDFARLGTYVPELALFNMPYFVETLADIEAVKKLDSVQAWIKKLESDYDIKVLSLNLVQGYRNVVCDKPVKTPGDLKGLTLRSPNTEIWRSAVTALGCSVQGMGRGDIYNNLVNKVIDGYEDVYPCIVSESYYEIDSVKTISETQHILLLNPVVVDAGWFNSLPAEYQNILIETSDATSTACSEQMLGKYTDEARQKCIEEGMTVIEKSEIDIAAFKEAALGAYAQLGLTETYTSTMALLGK